MLSISKTVFNAMGKNAQDVKSEKMQDTVTIYAK